MRKAAVVSALLVGLGAQTPAETRTSANYALTAESLDSGGRHAASGSYALDAAIGPASFATVLLETDLIVDPVTTPRGLVPLAGGNVVVRFVGSPSGSYTIQWTDRLGTDAWHDLPTTPPDADGVFQTTDTGSESVRFYRAESR